MKQRKRMTREEKAIVVAKYEDRQGTFKICNEHDISTSQFYRTLRQHGIKPDGRSIGFRSLSNEQTTALIKRYVGENASLETLAKEFGVCPPTVKNVLRFNDIPVRKGGVRFDELGEATKAKVVEMRSGGASINDIVRTVGVPYSHAAKVLRLNGMTQRLNTDSLTTTGGYRVINIATDDPLFSMARSRGKVMEHRYIMAKYLNRPLKEWETVHHIDGDKTNNAIENLQLRIGQHGKGEAYCCADCGSKRIAPIELAIAL